MRWLVVGGVIAIISLMGWFVWQSRGKDMTKIDVSLLGQNCKQENVCGRGMECVKYYGIAGTNGPEFASCEIRCRQDSDCPEGLSCATMADGPGEVCR